MSNAPAVEAAKLVRRFGDYAALDQVSFEACISAGSSGLDGGIARARVGIVKIRREVPRLARAADLFR